MSPEIPGGRLCNPSPERRPSIISNLSDYIYLHRKITKSAVWENESLLKIWIWCLVRASYKDRQVVIGNQIVELKPGEFVTGRNAASEELKMKGTSLWKRLKALEKLGNISIKSNNKFSVITVANWAFYQYGEDESDSRRTAEGQQKDNKGTAEGQQSDTNNKDNKGNKDKKEKKVNNAHFSEETAAIWKAYPNKKGTAQAMKKIPLLIQEYGYDKVLLAVERYKEEIAILKTDKKFIKYGSTFFNGGILDFLGDDWQPNEMTGDTIWKPNELELRNRLKEEEI